MMDQKNLYRECMTIVVPVYNRPVLIERCLDSIKAQTYRPLHVLVVDNASTDATVAHVSHWISANSGPDFSVVLMSESRPGAAFARDAGLRKVATEKVMFFDSDDAMRPGCVEAVMEAWKADPDKDIVAWPVAIHNDGKVKITHSISGCLLERHLVHAVFRTQGYAVKTDFIRKAGGWRGSYPNWNDLETGTRLLLLEPDVIPLDNVYADVYHQKESITGMSFSEKAGRWEMSLDAMEMSIKESGRRDASRLLNIITYRRVILAAHYARERHPELALPLYRQALRKIPYRKRPLIRFAYHWTRLRMRGAFSIIGRFL